MPILHLYCDLREPSLSAATVVSRQYSGYRLRTKHIRTGNIARTLQQLLEEMKPDDLCLFAFLHTGADQLTECARVLAAASIAKRKAIRFCCSKYSPEIGLWAAKNHIHYEDNDFEAARDQAVKTASKGTSLIERQWIQYRLMRTLIAGKDPARVFEMIIKQLRTQGLSAQDMHLAQRFHDRGEPDMAGGNYAVDRLMNPNAIDRLRERALQVGRSGLNALILGETGTGKESIAWYLHEFSGRHEQPFLALNCAFFEGERLESELFGHEQGAFTDAKSAKKGLVEEADKGSLFLDELPEMAPRVQAKLLRFLQDGSYTRMGGTRTLRANVRILSAAQPERMTHLRPDLYHRIAEVELQTTALRDMAPDAVVNIACNLAYRLMWRRVPTGTGERHLTPDIIRGVWSDLAKNEHAASLAGYAWPGNMRELSSMIKRYVLLGDDIFKELIDKTLSATTPPPNAAQHIYDADWGRFLQPVTSMAEVEALDLRIKELQGAFVRNLIASLGGRDAVQTTKLAEVLGCSYNTLMSHLAGQRSR